ncbi:uncharacterized protein Dvir_GJ14944 [Drosophila virilis]|uniref:Uncharacterized protein n=1 Tax=Drosophila virilis TaxID=7244 RepID=B4MFE3_DROVI|nr:uncharacterized protein Dvir_GJ14944 [Drosophila virilis]
MKPIGRDVKDVSVVIKLLQTPVTNITIRAEIMRRGFFKPPLYTFNVDACRFLESENRNPVANALYKFLRFDMYSNMNHTCPFDHDIILDHMRLDETFYLPLPIGLGEFTIKSYWLAYNVLRAKVNVNIEII